MRLTQMLTLIWIIGCGIVIIIIVRNPVPPPEPDCLVCGFPRLFGIGSIVFGVGGLIGSVISRRRTEQSIAR